MRQESLVDQYLERNEQGHPNQRANGEAGDSLRPPNKGTGDSEAEDDTQRGQSAAKHQPGGRVAFLDLVDDVERRDPVVDQREQDQSRLPHEEKAGGCIPRSTLTLKRAKCDQAGSCIAAQLRESDGGVAILEFSSVVNIAQDDLFNNELGHEQKDKQQDTGEQQFSGVS